MGVELIARSNNAVGLSSFNTSGWNTITGLLKMLGCAAEYLEHTSEGYFVPQSVCLDYSDEIMAALRMGIIKSVKVNDPSAPCGYKECLTLSEGGSVSEGDREWLESVAMFFETCGGCHQ